MPIVVAEAVRTALGKNCFIDTSAAVSAWSEMMKLTTPYFSNLPASQNIFQRHQLPLVAPVTSPNLLTVLKPAVVNYSAFDLLRWPVPAISPAQFGTELFNAQDVAITSGVATIDNWPFISYPQYSGTPQTSQIAGFVAVPLLGKLIQINWTEADMSRWIEFTLRTSTRVVARVQPGDNDCKQITIFLPFFNPTTETPVLQGVAQLSAWPEAYIGQFPIGGDTPASTSSIDPWTLTIKNSSGTVTSGYSFTIQEVPVPISHAMVDALTTDRKSVV